MLLYLLILIGVVQAFDVEHCEPISPDVKKDLCTFESNITQVQFPNFLGHETQEEAIEYLKGYELLLTSEKHCSDSLALFLCHTYLPICFPEDPDTIKKPCRAECEMSRYNCSSLMLHYSYPWPEILSCDKFEWAGSSSEDWCVGNPDYTEDAFKRFFPQVNATGGYNIITVEDDKLRVPNRTLYNSRLKTCPQIGLYNTNISHNFYGFDCGLPCYSSYYGPVSNLTLIRYWIVVWAALCCIATLFTVVTFLFEQDRFRYPERAIILSAVCYFFISVGFLMGFSMGDRLVCEPTGVNDGYSWGDSQTWHIWAVRQQNSKTGGANTAICFVQFFLVYYFMLASFLWWVILNLTWFLAAGLKWGHEAIALKAIYFHIVAWVLPAVLFICICLMGEIDGDRLASICFVGNFDTGSLQKFVIAPLSIFYIIGMAFLGLGLLSMCNVRKELHTTGKKTDKLETLMIRIGMFSVLYSIPATIVISCFLYENFQRPSWEKNYVSVCGSVQSNCLENTNTNANSFEPDANILTFNLIKYLMMLVTGLSTGFWVLLSFKTASRWQKVLLCKLPFCGGSSETAV